MEEQCVSSFLVASLVQINKTLKSGGHTKDGDQF